jgi:hypothetical protein
MSPGLQQRERIDERAGFIFDLKLEQVLPGCLFKLVAV